MGTRRHVQILLAASIAAFAFSSVAAAETAVATRWKTTGEAQSDCLGHAQLAIVRSGFDAGELASQSMNGKHGDYTAAIRCLAHQHIVFFVMSGPSSDTTLRYLDALYRYF